MPSNPAACAGGGGTHHAADPHVVFITVGRNQHEIPDGDRRELPQIGQRLVSNIKLSRSRGRRPGRDAEISNTGPADPR